MRSGAAKFKLSFTLPALTALALGGCAVVGSSPTFDEAASVFLGCRSTLGSYSLPKTVLNFKITKLPKDTFHVLQPIAEVRIPDNQHTFCLDYLRSALASDQVRVFKNKITAIDTISDADGKLPDAVLRKKRKITAISPESTPFLQLVASRAVDHTAGIIRRLIRTAFILLTNKGDFSPASRAAVGKAFIANEGADVVADFSVDPFDYQEMARVNDVVRKLGFCFVLEDYTFDRGGVNAQHYCRAPSKTAAERPPPAAEAIQKLHYLVAKPVDGIYFRPRAAYRLSIYINEDPLGRGDWRLGQIKNFHMENIMPIVSVGVGRAVFATRRTGLVFNDGTLTNVCISKGSELESAIEIPLDVIYGIIALPSEMISAAVSDATTAKELLLAQKRLVTAQNQYIKYLNKDKDVAVGDLTSPKSPKPTLVLQAPANTAVPADVPPDAGEIFKDSDGDPLSEICAELGAVRTLDGKNDDGSAKKGTF